MKDPVFNIKETDDEVIDSYGFYESPTDSLGFHSTGNPKGIILHLSSLLGKFILLEKFKFTPSKCINVSCVGPNAKRFALQKLFDYYQLFYSYSDVLCPSIVVIDVDPSLISNGDEKTTCSKMKHVDEVSCTNFNLMTLLFIWARKFRIDFNEIEEKFCDVRISANFKEFPEIFTPSEFAKYLTNYGIHSRVEQRRDYLLQSISHR